MAIPLRYNARNLMVRRTTTLMTAFSITLTVAVFVVLMALAQGLQTSLSATGQPLNILIMREGAQSESTSSVTRDSLQVIKYLHGIAKTDKGEPWVSPELIVLINLPRRGETQGSNVTIRGLGPDGPVLRPEFKIVEGRFFTSGLREVIASKKIAGRFQNCGLGDKLRFAKGYWTVVGVFDTGDTAYDSEIWTDVNDLATDFDRDGYSSVMVRAADSGSIASLRDQIANDRRLHLKPQTEREYYESQTRFAALSKALPLVVAAAQGASALDAEFLQSGCSFDGGGRLLRRHEYHVCGGGAPHQGNRHASGAGVLEGKHSLLFRARVGAHCCAGWRAGLRAGPAGQRPDHGDHQFRDFQ